MPDTSSPLDSDVGGNVRAILIFASYLATCSLLAVIIVKDLYRQVTRRRDGATAQRGSAAGPSSSPSSSPPSSSLPLVQLFSALAVASLAVTWFYMFSFFSLSYRSWAFAQEQQYHHQHYNIVAVPTSWVKRILSSLHSANPSLTLSSSSTTTLNTATAVVPKTRGMQLGAWLRDVTLFRDAWEVVLETSPRLFWSQPIFFITTAWSIFLGIETHRRKIPHSWAYMLLGQIVAISFAQNLFFLAVLLFPVELSQETGTAKTTAATPAAISKPFKKALAWTPSRYFYIICILLTLASVLFIPWVAGTADFMRVLLLPHVVLIVPSILHRIIPARWGVDHTSLMAANRYLGSLYQFILVLAVYCQAKVLLEAVYFPSENDAMHRHSNVYPINLKAARQQQQHGGYEARLSRIATALYDHPAVTSVGWDTLLCTASFLCWTATRALRRGGSA